MTSPRSNPANAPASANLRGAVDLAGLKNRPSAGAPSQSAPGQSAPGQSAPGQSAPGQSAPAAGHDAARGGGYVQQVTEESFPQIVQLSSEVPVVIDLTSARSESAQQHSAVLEQLANDYAGRFMLAHVDADTNPQVAQAFQVQAIPTTVAVLKGQPVPLFQGTMAQDQIRTYLDELLKVAEANGVTGSIDAAPAESGEEPAPAPLPPLHQEAFDAIEAGDYAGAAAAYRKALAEQPADHDAQTGLAQVELLQRLDGADGNQIRRRAADEPDVLTAQLDVADLDVSGGHVEDAFARLVRFVSSHAGDDKEAARARLVDLFDIVGHADPRVAKARSALARALF